MIMGKLTVSYLKASGIHFFQQIPLERQNIEEKSVLFYPEQLLIGGLLGSA